MSYGSRRQTTNFGRAPLRQSDNNRRRAAKFDVNDLARMNLSGSDGASETSGNPDKRRSAVLAGQGQHRYTNTQNGSNASHMDKLLQEERAKYESEKQSTLFSNDFDQKFDTKPKKIEMEEEEEAENFISSGFSRFGKWTARKTSKMRESKEDKAEREKKEKAEREAASEEEYQRMRKLAAQEDFSDIEPLDIVYRGGLDSFRRPVIVVIASHIPAKRLDPERLLLYIIRVMDEIVEKDYTLVYCHTQMSGANRPSFNWLRKAYHLFNRKYKKNLKALYIIHPGFWIKATLKFFKPFISSKFWTKLVYVSQVTDIYNYIKPDQIKLPNHVMTYKQKEGMAQPIFGVPLQAALDRDATQTGLPSVVEDCIKILEVHGPTVEGLFRIPGSKAVISELKMAYDRGEDVGISSCDDYHVVGGLLKLFLREMPNPCIPCDQYDDFIAITKKKVEFSAVKDTIKSGLQKLPEPNKILLHHLFRLLYKVSENSSVTKMNVSNLAIVFGPNLLKAPTNSEQRLIFDNGAVTRLLILFIENHTELFDL